MYFTENDASDVMMWSDESVVSNCISERETGNNPTNLTLSIGLFKFDKTVKCASE